MLENESRLDLSHLYIIKINEHDWILSRETVLASFQTTLLSSSYYSFLFVNNLQEPAPIWSCFKNFKALLVLETDEDYVRFGIPQDRLTPILTVTSTGVALTDRQSLPLQPLPTGLTPQELTQITGFSEYNDTNTSQTCEVGQSECQLQVPRCYEKKLRLKCRFVCVFNFMKTYVGCVFNLQQ